MAFSGMPKRRFPTRNAFNSPAWIAARTVLEQQFQRRATWVGVSIFSIWSSFHLSRVIGHRRHKLIAHGRSRCGLESGEGTMTWAESRIDCSFLRTDSKPQVKKTPLHPHIQWRSVLGARSSRTYKKEGVANVLGVRLFKSNIGRFCSNQSQCRKFFL